MTLAALEGKELQAAVGVGIKLHRSAMRLALAIDSGIAAGAAFAGATGVTTAGAASPYFWKIEPVRAARCLLMTWPLIYVTEYLRTSITQSLRPRWRPWRLVPGQFARQSSRRQSPSAGALAQGRPFLAGAAPRQPHPRCAAPFTMKTMGFPAASTRSTVAPTARRSCGEGRVGISTRITARIDPVIAGGVSMITRRTPALRIVSMRSGRSAIDTVAKSGSYVSAYS